MKIALFLTSILALICIVLSRSLNYNDKPKTLVKRKNGKKSKKGIKKPKKVGRDIFSTVHEGKGKQKKKKKTL